MGLKKTALGNLDCQELHIFICSLLELIAQWMACRDNHNMAFHSMEAPRVATKYLDSRSEKPYYAIAYCRYHLHRAG